MRRLLAGAAAGLALLAVVPHSAHADQIPRGWEGSRLIAPEGTVRTPRIEIQAELRREYTPRARDLLGNVHRNELHVATYVVVPAGLPAACGPAGGRAVTATMDPSNAAADEYPVNKSIPVTTVTADATLPCNGEYGIRVDAVYRPRPFGQDEEATLLGSVRVAAPPPEVPKASAVDDGGTVVVSWTPVADADKPADFLGYRVERRVGEGDWEPLATKLASDKRSFNDSAPQAGGGTVTYRVRTRRAAPPTGEAVSDGVTAELGATPTVPPGTDPGTSVPGGTDGGATGGGTAGTDGGTTGGTGGGGGGGGGVTRRGRTGIGTRAPRLGTPSQANFPPLLTPDDGGFEEEIDYGDRNLAGEEEGDELSSLFYEEDTGRGMAVPVATGFVLAAWAFHLRFLAKAARPGAAPVGVGFGAGAGAGLAPAHGRRRRRPEDDLLPLDDVRPLDEPLVEEPLFDPFEPDREPEPGPDPFDLGFGPAGRAEPAAPAPARPAPKVPYQAPAHYGPPSLADRYDPVAR